uniref:Uncharacterized protein n=1 Tax=Anguilla anguilla TaxID=7936 RepID=A0A0E9SEY0_ANGAN
MLLLETGRKVHAHSCRLRI